MKTNFKAVRDFNRFIVIDIETGEILDDAQGYGYSTAQKAYKGFWWKQQKRKMNEK